jgi:hypothetical protein
MGNFQADGQRTTSPQNHRYPWAPPLIESGPGPALLGIKHTPHRVSPPAGVGAAGEDAAGTIKVRAQRASRAAAADDPVGGAADRRP